MAFGSSRLWKILAIFVVVWAVVLIGLDRGGKYLAEYEAAKAIQNSQHLSSRPDVSLNGVPFLTQLIGGEFDDVTIDANGVIVPLDKLNRDLRLSQMHVDLKDVSVSRSFDSFHTNTADATALITYADLGATLGGVNLSYQGNGHVQGSKSLFGLTASVTAQPTLAGQSLHFNDLQISVPGPLSSQVSSAVHKLFDGDLPLTGLPFGLQVKSLTVAQDGVHLALHGENISYSS
jgi:hypothetical protein